MQMHSASWSLFSAMSVINFSEKFLIKNIYKERMQQYGLDGRSKFAAHLLYFAIRLGAYIHIYA